MISAFRCVSRVAFLACAVAAGSSLIAQETAPAALPYRGEQPVRARHGMVVSVHHLAADVGLGILEEGGNAVDAAVATGFALAVVHPIAGNLGGGGFMLIREHTGKTIFLDYREKLRCRMAREHSARSRIAKRHTRAPRGLCAGCARDCRPAPPP